MGVERGGREHLIDRHDVELGIADEAVTIHERAFNGFHQQVIVIGAAFRNRSKIEALQRAHDLQGRHALRGRLQAHQFAAAISDTQRRFVARMGAGEVASGEWRTGLPETIGNSLSQVAFIEFARAETRNALDAFRQRRLHEALVDRGNRPVRREGRREAGQRL
jgi:hypothetical protein